MRERFNDDKRLRWLLGDVRDRDRLRRAMTGVEVVIHAAALKRIEVGMTNPIEMIRTNVDGTVNVVEAAQDARVERVVYLSTDKAVFPCSTYGYTKALAESLCLAANNTVPSSGPKFLVTKYGNVFGSTGSLVPKWLSIIAGGATSVPCTDPDCTRFYMTPQQAVDLVMEAIACETLSDEPFIPMLPAFRVGDLAEAMGVEVTVTGLPPWEKKHESMRDGLTSDMAPRMTVEDLKQALSQI